MNIIVTGSHPLMRLGIERVLGTPTHDRSVTATDDIENTARLIIDGTLRCDLLIAVDLSPSPLFGLNALSRLTGGVPLLVVINPQLTQAAKRNLMGLGVAGIVPADMGLEDFQEAVRSVLEGHTHIGSSRASAGFAGSSPQTGPWNSLTRKEVEIAHLLVRGLSNKEIARQQGVQEVTVKYHLGRMFRKLSVHNRTQLVSLLMRDATGPS